MLTETGQALTRAGSASKRRLRGAAAGALMALTLWWLDQCAVRRKAQDDALSLPRKRVRQAV